MRIRGREIPLPFLLGLAGVSILAAFLVATGSGLVNIESLYLFLLGNTVATITTMALAALGGAFLGMLAGHYIFASRSFTPFERRVIETLEGLDDVAQRLDDVEENLADDVADLQDDVDELREEIDDLVEDRQVR